MIASLGQLLIRYRRVLATARRRGDRRALVVERLEERALMTASNVVIYNAPTINTFADVGFENNPVASVDAYINGKKVTDAGQLRAEINWGDGSGWQAGEIGQNKLPGTRIPFIVKGSHEYEDAQKYNIQVRVTLAGLVKHDSKVECVASVVNMPLPTGNQAQRPDALGGPKQLGNTKLVLYAANQLTAIQGKEVKGTVASGDGYYNGIKDVSPGDYKVQINWGDSPEWHKGEVVSNSVAGSRIPLTLKGSHTYANTGTYKVTVQFTGPDGHTLSKQTSTVLVKANPRMVAPVVLKASVAVNNWQTQAIKLGQQMDRWVDNVQAAVNDALNSFARGMGTNEKPKPLSLSHAEKHPFSRSFFDAGRMLKSIVQGTQELPGQVVQLVDGLGKLSKFIVDNPKVLTGHGLLEVARDAALADPVGTATALYKGFEGFRDAYNDPAGFGGSTIPGSVLLGIFGKSGPLAGKIGKADKVFQGTDGARPIPGYNGPHPDLTPPSQVIPGGVKPMAAVLNEIRWSSLISKVNEGFGTLPGRATNCPYTAWVTDQILAGYKLQDIEKGLMLKSAPPSLGKPRSWIESRFPGKSFGAQILGPALVKQMSDAGNGARGIVRGLQTVVENGQRVQKSHLFNVVNNHGVITFYDAQSGGLASLDRFEGFMLMRTN
jgi:PKD repeat protein